MITISPQAAKQIIESARQQPDAEKVYLRLAARMDDKGSIEYGMGFDEQAEGDLLIAAGDISILVSPGSVELLSGATLDFVEINPGEQRFIFINPNDPSHRSPKPGG